MLQLGIVTYNIAKDWDLPTILERLERLRYGGVELRTTHAHGVEVELSEQQRADVRKRFEDSPVQLVGLGSTYEFHASDPAEVKRNIEGAKAYVRLAHDVGARGVKVRPNGIPKGDDPETVFKRIADALNIVGQDAHGYGVEIRVEVHGSKTAEWPAFAQIMNQVQNPNVRVCWNSNASDVTAQGTIAPPFKMVADRIGLVHMRDLTDEAYPWRELFSLLTRAGYDGFTLAEIPESADPERVLQYYRALWLSYQPQNRASS